jgi:hypothetical protein
VGELVGSSLFWPALIVGAVIVAAVVLMGVGWRGRRRRQAGLGPLPAPPAELGAVLHSEDALYLATTRADAPLDRIALRGLGFRAEARVSVTASGVLLELVGEPPLFIAASRLRGVGVATWTVDRGVERDGLVFVRWELGDTAVDSYLRSADSSGLLAALDGLVPASPDSVSENESDNT